MRAWIGEWIENLAVYYILLVTFLNLVPTGKYQKYIRFFMGLLMIGMMMAPVIGIFEKKDSMLEEFVRIYQKEDQKRIGKEMENLQKKYIYRGYEKVIAEKVKEDLLDKGVKVSEVVMRFQGERLTAQVWVKKQVTQEERGEIADAMERRWGIGENAFQIRLEEGGKSSVDPGTSSGTASYHDPAPGSGKNKKRHKRAAAREFLGNGS